MEIGLSLGICRGGRGGSFSPDSLTGLAATVLPAESRAAGLLWQDTAKTIAATADGDPVRVAVCPLTAVEFTAPSDATRPLLYEEGGGKWSLSFDGVDDNLLTSTTTGFPTGNSPILIAHAAQVPVLSNAQYLVALGSFSNNNAYAFDAGARVVGFNNDWTTGLDLTVNTYQVYDYAHNGTVTDCYRDGVSAAGTYSTTRAIAYGEVRLFAFVGGGFNSAGRLSGLVIAGSASSAEVRQELREYLVATY